MIDLRSDTVTRPDDEMRRAMAEAEVGDDVYGEDPTVRRLEEQAAAATGTEAGLFVPSGTMGNQISIHLHTRRGDELLCNALSHVVHYEMGAMATLSGVQPKLLEGADGRLRPEQLSAAIVRDVPYQSRTTAMVIENTHNLAGGTLYDRPLLESLLTIAGQRGVKAHLDGARVFNAAIALQCEVSELTQGFDSVTFCLSKGLGAPVGSVVCGKSDWIAEARRVRKMLGGGMRQAGVLAAAGLLALRDGPARLVEDHANAELLADGLSEAPGIEVQEVTPRTNIVVCTLKRSSSSGFAAQLAQAGVQAIPLIGDRLRFVTHRDVSRKQIVEAIEAAKKVASELAAPRASR